MSHSLNEIAALAKRAARGAGLSWGMAEEAGRAARWLASYDLTGPALLCDVLTKNDRVPQEQVAPSPWLVTGRHQAVNCVLWPRALRSMIALTGLRTGRPSS